MKNRPLRNLLTTALTAAVCIAGSVSNASAQTTIEVKPANPGSFVPITQVVIDDDGTEVIQTSPASGTANIGLGKGVTDRRGTPVTLKSVTVDDNGTPVVLQYFNEITDVVLQGFAAPGVTGNGGVGVVYPDGTKVEIGSTPAEKDAFRAAVRDANENQDLVNYLFYDGNLGTMPPAGAPDFDLVYGKGLEENDYLLVMERDGNTFFAITPLDADGNPIAGANIVRFGFPTGPSHTMHDWNTGYTNIHYQSSQSLAFTVAKVSKFFEGTTVAPGDRVVFGFRIDNDGNADVKFFGLSPDPFENNTILPAGLGNYVWVDTNEDGIQDPDENGLNGVVVNLLNADGTPFLNAFGEPRTTVTVNDSDGNPGYYAFAALPAGDYRVEFVLPDGYNFTSQNADSTGVNGALNSDATLVSGITDVVSLAAGEINFNIDAGLVAAVPGIALEKTATPETYGAVGDTITYAFKVTNTGNAKLFNVTILDPLITVNGGPVTLDIGESDEVTFSGTYSITADDLAAGSVLNTAKVSGTTSWGAEVDDEDSATVTAVIPKVPGISLVKTGSFVPGVEIPAAGCDVFGLAHNFNALIFGHLDAENGDTDGRLAVAGTATIRGGYSVGTMVKGHFIPVTSGGVIDRFIVAGDLYDGTFGVNGNIVVGGERFGPDRELTNGNLLRFVNPITFDADGNVPADGSGTTFAELLAEMTARSTTLGGMADRGVVTKDASLPYQADFVGNDPELNVFNVTASEWSRNGSSINIEAPADSTVLINIHGDSVHIENVGMNVNGVSLENVVFNYVGVSNLTTINFAHLGSVLAPKASAKFVAGSIDGRAVLGGDVETSSGFEFHNYYFVGEVCPEPEMTPSKIVYVFEVENTGDLPLTNISIDDPFVTVIGGPIDLAPGESDTLTFTAEKILSPEEFAAGSFTNTASVTGTAPDGSTVSAFDSDVQNFGAAAPGSDPSAPGSGGAGSGGSSTPGSGSGGTGGAGAPPLAPGSLPGSGIGGGSGGGVTKSDSAAIGPVIIPETKKTVETVKPRTVIKGKAVAASFIEVKQDGSKAKRFRVRGSGWKIRTAPLDEGRNVIRIRAVGPTGKSRPVRFVVQKKDA